MPISTLLAEQDFGPDEGRILIKAFDDAWSTVKASRCPAVEQTGDEVVRRLLAKRIIATAGNGERNPIHLVNDAIGYLSRWYQIDIEPASDVVEG